MKKKSIDSILLAASVGGYFLMSLSFVLMPVQALGFVPGIMFWLGLITGATLQFLLEARRKTFFKTYGADPGKLPRPRNGLLTFASDPIAKVIDLLLPVCLLVTVVAFVATQGFGTVCFVGIALTVFLFCLHCILNGRIWAFVFHRNKLRRMLDKKKETKSEKEREKNG